MPTEQALSERGKMFAAEGDLGAKRNVVEVGVIEDGQLRRCLAAAPESATEISGKPEPTIEVVGATPMPRGLASWFALTTGLRARSRELG